MSERSLEERRRVARWRARRGTLELDEILNRYLDHHLDTMSVDMLSQLEALLALQDDVLIRWLVSRQPVDREGFEGLVENILR